MVKRRVARKGRKAVPKRMPTTKMPNTGLARYWAAVNAGHRADPRTGRKKVHRG